MYSPQTNEMILQLTHLKTTVWHFALAFLLLRWLCFMLYIHIIRFPSGAVFLWLVTIMPVVMWLAECEPGAWKKQEEQTGGMRCSPGAVTSTGTWVDFGSSHTMMMCAVTESEKAADGGKKKKVWLLLCWIMGFLSPTGRTAGFATWLPKISEGSGKLKLPST